MVLSIILRKKAMKEREEGENIGAICNPEKEGKGNKIQPPAHPHRPFGSITPIIKRKVGSLHCTKGRKQKKKIRKAKRRGGV